MGSSSDPRKMPGSSHGLLGDWLPYVDLTRQGKEGSGFGGFAWLSWVCPAQGRTGPVTMGTATEPWAEEETLRAMARLLTCASKLQPAQVTHAGDTCY